MNYTTIFKYIATLTLLAVFSIFQSCQQFVQVDPPKSQLVRETVFRDYSTAESALVNIYGKLRDYLVINGGGMSRMTWILGLYADELTYYSNQTGNASIRDIFDNNLTPIHPYAGYIWANSYNLIYAVNSIIEGIGAATDSNIAEEDKARLIGEALFTRSYIYFHLVNLYGDIPYVTGTDYRKNTTVGKQAVAEVYESLEEDLLSAIDNLPEAYDDAERVRPNAATARALLARVYLYNENWEAAEDMASRVINNSLYVWVDDLDKVFLKSSSATIWQLKPGTDDGNTHEANDYIFTSAPPPNMALSEYMVQSFTDGDKRLDNWVGAIADDAGNTYHYAYKYKIRGPSTPSQEFSIQFRLAEQYLIRAEANIRLRNYAAAREDVNKIRQRAGLTTIDSNSEDSLMEVLIAERNRELFLEYPHRFFDLVRTGNTDFLAERKAGWDDTDRLWPIPESELLVNPNLLPQNEGY